MKLRLLQASPVKYRLLDLEGLVRNGHESLQLGLTLKGTSDEEVRAVHVTPEKLYLPAYGTTRLSTSPPSDTISNASSSHRDSFDVNNFTMKELESPRVLGNA